MEYQALYRKYRPQRFADVVGQDHVTHTLAREVSDSKVAHAYLFAGPRGTGKTTTARLLAKALNCTSPGGDGEPCDDCASCAGITEGTSLDVIELDAASHNKVEDIREIRVNVGTVASVGGAMRVYILDEAHMLSRAAGNALLKTLEEPPQHVVFVLATTEPYKLLDTIRSRSQRFDFHPVPVEILIEYLGTIADREGFTPDPDGLRMVATHAKGSVRDALSLLEQVAALGRGRVESSVVARALGLADTQAFATLARSIVDQDTPGALGLVAALAAQGADLRRFVAEAVGFFRGVFLAQYAPNLEEVADESLDTLEEWRRHAKEMPPADVLRAVDHLSEALLQLRQGREERLVVELSLIRLTRPDAAVDGPSLAARLQRLEDRVRSVADDVRAADPTPRDTAPTLAAVEDPAAPFAVPTHTDPPAQPSVPAVADPAVSPDQDEVTSPSPERASTGLELPQVESIWPAIVARMRDEAGPRRHALVKEAVPAAVDGSDLVLEVPARLPFHLEQLDADDDLKMKLVAVTSELLGTAVGVRFSAGPASDEDAGEPARAPDKDELLEEEGEHATDPTELVVDVLGGEVVAE